MPIDPQRLARVRAHLLAAAAIATVGCGSGEKTVNEPIHTNEPIHINPGPDQIPTAAPSSAPTSAPSAAPTAAQTPSNNR